VIAAPYWRLLSGKTDEQSLADFPALCDQFAAVEEAKDVCADDAVGFSQRGVFPGQVRATGAEAVFIPAESAPLVRRLARTVLISNVSAFHPSSPHLSELTEMKGNSSKCTIRSSPAWSS
jgi:hypothetical protein